MKILKVLLLSGFVAADADYQIRTKIELDGDSSSRGLDNGVKNGIKDDLDRLFCKEMEFDGTEKCDIDILDNYKNVEDNNGKVSGEVQFAVNLEMEDGKSISKSDLKEHFKEEVPNVITTPEPTTTKDPVTEPEPTEGPDSSGESSGEGSVDFGQSEILELEFPNMVLADLIRNIRESESAEPDDYKYIKKESLNIDSFVICAGECKDEGFWMMIAFICTGAVCLIFSGLSCLGSRRVRQISSGACTLMLLGLMGGVIYVGVTEKVNWAITGGYIGGIVGLIILVNVIGCIKTKRTAKKVKNDEIEMYWDDLAKRDNATKSD